MQQFKLNKVQAISSFLTLLAAIILTSMPMPAHSSFWQTKVTPYFEWFELNPNRDGLNTHSAELSDWRMNLGLALNRDHLYYGYRLSTFYYRGKGNDSDLNTDIHRDFRFQALLYKKHDLVPGLKMVAGARFRQTWLNANLRLADAYDFFAGGEVAYTLNEKWRAISFATLGVPERLDNLNWRLEFRLDRRISDQSSVGLAAKYGKLHYDELPTTYHSISVLYHTSL